MIVEHFCASDLHKLLIFFALHVLQTEATLALAHKFRAASSLAKCVFSYSFYSTISRTFVN